MANWLNLPYRDMTLEQLLDAMTIWSFEVITAPGWSSAYFSAQQCTAISREGRRRGIAIANPHPVKLRD